MQLELTVKQKTESKTELAVEMERDRDRQTDRQRLRDQCISGRPFHWPNGKIISTQIIIKFLHAQSTQTLKLTWHTPNIASPHPPPNSSRFSYATEGVLFISAQLSSDAVSALRMVRVRIYDCRSNLAPKHARKQETHPPRVKKKRKKKKSSVSIETIVVLFALV